MDDQILTVAEVALRLRVSKMTVYRLIRSGELASVRVGRSFRVEPGALKIYLDRSRTGAARVGTGDSA